MSDEHNNNYNHNRNHNSDSSPAHTNPLRPTPDSSVTTFSSVYALCVGIVMETVGSANGSVEMNTQSYTDPMQLKNEPIQHVNQMHLDRSHHHCCMTSTITSDYSMTLTP